MIFSSFRCWISSQFPQSLLVTYITTVAFPFLVVLFNFCMVCLVVFKLCGVRRRSRGSDWKRMNEDNWARLRKDGATLLGLSCVLGLPWGLAGLTYASAPGIYLFTVLNFLQGQYEHGWCEICHVLGWFVDAISPLFRYIHLPLGHGYDLQASSWKKLLAQGHFLSTNDY